MSKIYFFDIVKKKFIFVKIIKINIKNMMSNFELLFSQQYCDVGICLGYGKVGHLLKKRNCKRRTKKGGK